MTVVKALQHIFCNVRRGLAPERGDGFQTVAASPELVGTEDLRALEDAAFYSVSNERRRRRELPVKETFFRLPSQCFAVGRTADWGQDPRAREGNYLTHHLVLTRDALLAAGADPFAIFEAARLAEPGVDLTPRALPPLPLEVGRAEGPKETDAAEAELLAALAASVLGGGAATALLVGDESRSRDVLRRLFASLAEEERLLLTFSTHFYESHHLRPLFACVTVGHAAEAPSSSDEYLYIDLDGGPPPRPAPRGAYARWLTDCLLSGRRSEVERLNRMLNRLRERPGARLPEEPPTSARACDALWERAGQTLARMLASDARLARTYLTYMSSPNALADALLDSAGPSKLCAHAGGSDSAREFLSLLHSRATAQAWREWTRRWRGDPALNAFLQGQSSWWQFWRK